ALMCRPFFVQAEDGIRDRNVTGVQTCALPISIKCTYSVHGTRPLVIPVGHSSRARQDPSARRVCPANRRRPTNWNTGRTARKLQIGRASCRERVKILETNRQERRNRADKLHAG